MRFTGGHSNSAAPRRKKFKTEEKRVRQRVLPEHRIQGLAWAFAVAAAGAGAAGEAAAAGAAAASNWLVPIYRSFLQDRCDAPPADCQAASSLKPTTSNGGSSSSCALLACRYQ